MDVEKDLLIVDEVGVSSQQAGREQTFAQPVFSDPERVYCRVADPGQERLRRSEGSGGYSYADAMIVSGPPNEFDKIETRVIQSEVNMWMENNKLKFNQSITKLVAANT
ncbi:hypothetical protein HELRODRAFT_182113 [Helobdella robusta]|uniref:Uncharacterized protein n=1 Tax=Helobdella robusta TaxID=6412 RepID=T1FHS1_HELRO|nr:hypothetical protein HELRODRAFT_182113 [Helobdella robusta]ESN91255.1 hypothetical protein HELRODRAFT_182113 [Helobdella robusta]